MNWYYYPITLAAASIATSTATASTTCNATDTVYSSTIFKYNFEVLFTWVVPFNATLLTGSEY